MGAAGKVRRAGPMFVASLAKAQVAAPDQARAQSYNVFADPSLELAFWGGAPTPPPTPAPTPSGKCHAISAVVDDDWCTANCAAGFCPSDLCQCDNSVHVVV